MNYIFCRRALTVKVRVFLILSFLFFIGCQSLQTKQDIIALPSAKILVKNAEPIRQLQSDSKNKSPLVISFLGDVIIHDRLRLREESSNEGYQNIWASIQNYIDRSDLTYANLEGPVAPELGGVSGFPLFNFPEEIIPTLKQYGFDIVSTANNHALDRQARGIEKTIENLIKYQLPFAGTISSPVAITEKKLAWWGLTPLKDSDLKVAWIACTEMTNGHVDKENQVLYCFKDRNKIRSLLHHLRSQNEIAGIIITPHWGEEDKFEIEETRRSWAQQLLNEGAAAIVGSHPHVVQKIEDFKTSDGRNTFIAYSMGNFVSNQPKVPNKTSMMLLSKWKITDLQKLELADLKYISLWMNRTIEKDNTAKYRISTVWDFVKMPSEAVAIWQQQLGFEKRLKTSDEANMFFSPTDKLVKQ